VLYKTIRTKMKNETIELNEIELMIVKLLAQGILNKNLCEHINLSNSAIEKRKKKLKEKLNFNGNDEDLLKIARKNEWI